MVWEACWLACFFGVDSNMYVAEKPTPWIKDRASAMEQAVISAIVASAIVGLGSWCQTRWLAGRGSAIRRTRETILADGVKPALPTAAYMAIALLLGVAVANGSIVAAGTDVNSYAYTRSGPLLVEEASRSTHFRALLLNAAGTALGSVLAPALILWWSRKAAAVPRTDSPTDQPSP